jgi:phage tail-like protein
MRFAVTVDDIDLGSWATCQGLKVDFNPTAVDEGGTNDYQPWIPGALKYDKVTLTRVVSAADSGKVQTWLREQSKVFRPGTAAIVLYDNTGARVMTWDLQGVVPASWQGPSLDASSSKFALETLVLCHEGFL